MNPKWRDKYIELIHTVVEHVRGIVLVLLTIITILGFATGYKYYNYTQEEPQYCATCHIMDDAFIEWGKGKHSLVVCQRCHQLSMLEQNQLLVAYVVKGTQQGFSQTHGRIRAWDGCRGCHEDVITQGEGSLLKTGHAHHVILRKLDCRVCHKNKLHNFQPPQMLCLSCHKDKTIHGLEGNSATYKDTCLSCHSFLNKKAPGIKRDRCDICHKKIPQEGPMAGVKCHQCHQPHRSNKVTIDSCLRFCHNEINKGQAHRVHYDRSIYCFSCHTPHSWKINIKIDYRRCKPCHERRLYEHFDK